MLRYVPERNSLH